MSDGHATPNRIVSRLATSLSEILSSFAPIPAVSIAAVCIALGECVLLPIGEQPLYASGVSATLCGLGGLWVTWLVVAWLMSMTVLAVRAVRVRKRRGLALSMSATAAVAGLFALLVWLASWTMYLQIGRFGGWDTIQFAVSYDLDDLWTCMGPGEQRAVVILLAAIPFMIGGIWAVLWKGAGNQWKPSVRFLLPAGLAALSVCGLRAAQIVVEEDPSESRSLMSFQAISTQAGPGVTMYVSCYRELTQEPIRPVLTRSELVPLPQHSDIAHIDDTRTYSVAVETDAAVSADRSVTERQTTVQRPVIVIAFESLRGDVIGKSSQGIEITPNLNRLAEAGVTFSRSYAQSTHSDYADVCLMSSLYPLRTRAHHFYRADDPWPKRLAFDHFKAAGYSTAIISSQNETWGGMEAFLETPSLDLFFHSDRHPEVSHVADRDPGFARDVKAGVYKAGSLPDDFTASQAITWIKQAHAAGGPFLLSMNFQSSHFPYWTPLHDQGGSTGPFQPSVLDDDATFLAHPPEKTPTVRNAFWNGLHYADQQLGKIVATLEELGIFDDVLLVVAGENGEAFHEGETLDGRSVVGHAGAAVEKALHVATVMHCPNLLEPVVNDEPFESVDLLPTISGLCGLPWSPLWQGQDALSEDRIDPDDRFLFFHVNTSIEREDGLLYGGRWKYRMSLDSGVSKLFDLAADPMELTDVWSENPEVATLCRDAHQRWRAQQLAYYHFAHYYSEFCPPTPPRSAKSFSTHPTSAAAPRSPLR